MKSLIKIILYNPLYNLLILFVYLTPGHNVGVAIIVLTILVRLALVPSTNKTFQAQKEMKALQPKLDEIKAKYPKEEQAQKTMELYQEHKINPLGSCLPMLIQIPIIFVLYRVFQVGLNTSHFQLLYSFTPRPEYINTMFLGLDLAKPEKLVLPIVVALSQLLQMWLMQKLTGANTKSTGDKQADAATMMTKQMMFFAPVMTYFIALKLPAALPIYWIVTTVFSTIQQWWFFKGSAMSPVKVESGVQTQAEVKKPEEKKKEKEVKKLVGTKTKKNDVVVTVRRKGE